LKDVLTFAFAFGFVSPAFLTWVMGLVNCDSPGAAGLAFVPFASPAAVFVCAAAAAAAGVADASSAPPFFGFG
jgi:hypothetical protein